MNPQLDPGLLSRLRFDPFELRPAERLLLRDGAAVPLGSRAMDLLLCLLEREGEVVGTDELLERVWRGVNVESTSLRFQVNALRKALGDDGARFVVNVAGRGYSFVAPVARDAAGAASPSPFPIGPRPALPAAPTGAIGRGPVIDHLARQITTTRFVTVVGPAGIGKTTVALALAHRMAAVVEGEAAFVDLSTERGDASVAGAVAAALQLVDARGEAGAEVVAQLRARPLLLVLDGCEHVIAGAAALAQAIWQAAPRAHILATSREPLNVDGEYVHRLEPLETPPPETPSFEAVRAYPAAQLFIERLAASGGQIGQEDADAGLVAEICRKLDGVPLAIELAAARVSAFGLATTHALLDSRLRLSWPGRRTAPPRHATLSAALDWSYTLLSADEAQLLRGLSAFAGPFTLDAVETVLGDLPDGPATATLLGLVSKSLVSAQSQGLQLRYRLLDVTRAYAAERLAETGEAARVAARHGDFALTTLRTLLDAEAPPVSAAAQGEPHDAVAEALADARKALAWALTERHDLTLGARLAAAAAHALLKTSRFAECRICAEAGLAQLPDASRESRLEMELQGCLGLSRMLAGANTPDVEAALGRALELADRFDDPRQMIAILSGLSLYRHRTGDARQALASAERAAEVAEALEDPVSRTVAADLLATAHHLTGAHRLAGRHSEAALRAPPPARRLDQAPFGLDHRNRALSTLARVHWLAGRAQLAVQVARRAVDEAAALEHPVSQAVVLSGVLPVFLGIGDLATAGAYIARLRAIADDHSIRPHRDIATVFQGIEQAQRGDAWSGVQLMRTGFDGLEARGNRLMRILLGPDYIDGLLASGQVDTGRAELTRTFRLIDDTGYSYNLPELLRLRGEIMRRTGGGPAKAVGEALRRACALARRQDALSWALRAAVDLLELQRDRGRPAAAERLLAGLLARMPDPTETPDRLRAIRLLAAEPPS